MTVKQMIQALQTAGHTVSFKKRSDGGYLITSIDNNIYTGAAGNIQARQQLGQSLSSKKQAQLNQATATHRKATISPDIEALFKRTQALWRKNVEQGKVTKKKLRWNIKHLGEAEAKRKLERLHQHAKGYVYPEQVEAYCQILNRLIEMSDNDDVKKYLQFAYDEIHARKNQFRYTTLEAIRAAYPSSELYRVYNSPQDARNYWEFIKRIMKKTPLKTESQVNYEKNVYDKETSILFPKRKRGRPKKLKNS